MKKQRHIYFFLPNFSVGGAGNSILNICKSIKNKKDKIIIISQGKNAYKSKFRKLGIKLIELKEQKAIFAIIKIYKLLNNENKNKNCKQIFVSNINYANVLSSIFIKNIKNIKLILIERTPFQELEISQSFMQSIKKRAIYFLAKLFYRRANYIVGNSYNLSNYIMKKIHQKVITIYPIIEIKNIKKRYNRILNLTWIGRNSDEKNLIDLLNCFRYLDKENIIINIVTDHNVNNLIKSYSTTKFRRKIKIFQFKNEKSFVNKIYKKTDIYISTSLYEGFPNTLVDAVNNLCLVITSNNFGGYKEIIKNQNYGLIYETRNYLDLYKKIKFAIDNFDNNKTKITKAKQNLKKLAFKHNLNYKNFFNKI